MSRGQAHTVAIHADTARVRVYFNRALVADTRRALIVRETGLPDRLYLPREDIHGELEPTSRRSTCPYKGQARYWTLHSNGQTAEDVAWSYLEPTPTAEPIRDYLSFYTDRVSIERES